MILSLLFGGMTAGECFGAQNNANVQNNFHILQAGKGYPQKFIDGYLGTKSLNELMQISQNSKEDAKCLRILLERWYLAQKTQGYEGIYNEEDDETSAETLKTCINSILQDYGITLADVQLNNLKKKFEHFFKQHPRRVVMIDPVPMRTETELTKVRDKIASFFKRDYFWTEFDLGNGVNLIVINRAKNSLMSGKHGINSGDISFIIVGSRQAVKKLGLKYQIKSEDMGCWSKFVEFAGDRTGLGRLDFDKIVTAGLKNVKNVFLIGEDEGSFGVRMYKARHLDYLGMLNSSFGDEIFDREIKYGGTDPIFFYHKKIGEGDDAEHIIAFYIEKNLLFQPLHIGTIKPSDIYSVKTTEFNFSGKKIGGHTIPLWIKNVKSVGAFTPFKDNAEKIEICKAAGIPNVNEKYFISFGKHERENSVLYLVKISESKFKEYGLDDIAKLEETVAQQTKEAIIKTGEAVGKGVKAIGKGVKKTGETVGKGAKAIGKGIKKTGEAIGRGARRLFNN